MYYTLIILALIPIGYFCRKEYRKQVKKWQENGIEIEITFKERTIFTIEEVRDLLRYISEEEGRGMDHHLDEWIKLRK